MKVVTFFLIAMLGFISCDDKNQNIKKSTMIPANERILVKDDFKIFSTPFSKKITIVFGSPKTGKALLLILFSNGMIFDRREFEVDKGMNSWDFNCEFKSSGTYFVKFRMDTIERSGKVFKTVS